MGDSELAGSGTPTDGNAVPEAKPGRRDPSSSKTWRPWTIGVSALLAVLVSLLLLVGDGLAGVLTNLGGGPRFAGTWLGVAAAGHGVLALTSAFLLGVGIVSAARRRAAALTAWATIPVGIGWFLLCGRLAAG